MDYTADQILAEAASQLGNDARVLVVGGGFIGSRAARLLSERGVEVDVISRSNPRLPTATANIVVSDVSDSATLKPLIESASHIFYCAGGLMPSQTMSLEPHDIALTLAPLASVLEAAVSEGTHRRFVFLSSGGTVYGAPRSLPVREEDPLSPISGYGVLKLCSENIVSMFVRQHGLKATILRCANVYGDNQPTKVGQGAVGVFLERILNNEPIRIYGDGSVVRDYVHIDDVIAAMAATTIMPVPEILNVGSGHGTTLKELADTIGITTGLPVKIEYLEARANDVPRIVLDITALTSSTGLRPVLLSEGLVALWQTYRTIAGHSQNMGSLRPRVATQTR